MNAKLSIIVPVYNAEKYLQKAINSLIDQSYKNIEILLINDGSTDNSKDICKELALKDKRIIFFDKKNSGVSSTRNFGIEHSNGDYITFIDADDYVDKEAYKNVMEKLINTNVDCVKFSYLKESPNNKVKYNYVMPINQVINIEKKERFVKEIFSSKDFESIWNLVIKKSILIENNIKFDENLIVAEDFKFMCSCISKVKKIYILNEPYYHYVINNSSVTQKYNLDKIIVRCDNIISSYKDSTNILKIELCKNKYCVNKTLKLLYSKINIIATNESWKDYKNVIEKINQLESYKKFINECNMSSIPTSYFFYLKSAIIGNIKRIARKVIYK